MGGPRLPTRRLSLPRFLFILLGPPGKAKSYNEIGRAIATLMVDDVSRCNAPSTPGLPLLRAEKKKQFSSYRPTKCTLKSHNDVGRVRCWTSFPG